MNINKYTRRTQLSLLSIGDTFMTSHKSIGNHTIHKVIDVFMHNNDVIVQSRPITGLKMHYSINYYFTGLRYVWI